MESTRNTTPQKTHRGLACIPRKPLATAILAGLLVACAAQGGVIVTNQSINFAAADFSSGNTASKNWLIYSSTGASNTPVWDGVGMTLSDNGRLYTTNASLDVDSYVIFKVTSSAGPVSGFTWGVRNFNVSGNGDDSFAWQYKTDTSSWINFYTHGVGVLTLVDQTYNVLLATPSTAVYIRAATLEGPTTGDANYAQVRSNDAPGGLNANSFVKVTIVPEPGTLALVFAGLSSLLLARKNGHGQSAPDR